MMKIRFLILALILVTISVGGCLAQEWDSVMDSYTKNQIERPVTPQEFDKAIETVQGYQKKEKKPKKKNKGEQQFHEPPVKEMTVPDSSGILLRLPVSVYWNNTVIPDGFYLVEKAIKDKNYYLKISQGGKSIVEIPAKVVDGKYTGNIEVVVQNTTKNSIELHYIDREVCLESDLYISTNNFVEE